MYAGRIARTFQMVLEHTCAYGVVEKYVISKHLVVEAEKSMYFGKPMLKG